MTEKRHSAGDERAAAVLQPDTLLASQYFDWVRRCAAQQGERRLMVAVLEDGVLAYLNNADAPDRRRRALFLEAEAWVESHDASWFYSFANVCAALDLHADHLRRGLRAWKTRGERACGEARPREQEKEGLRMASGA